MQEELARKLPMRELSKLSINMSLTTPFRGHPDTTMAGAPLKLLYVLLLLCISLGGILGQPCGLSSIRVNQHTTGARRGFDFEFAVEIKNACTCAQRNVRMHAPGFASQKLVDPALFRRDVGGAFLVNGGNPIPPGSTVKFTYSWDHATLFSPAGSQPLCR